jgi:predicted nucleic acid-binding protein
MGLILDSSVLVTAERDGQNARATLQTISHKTGNVEIAISVVTLMELAHGVVRANTPERRAKRKQFIEDIVAAVPVHTVTPAVAWRAGTIDGESQARGLRIPVADLLIGATALSLEFAVGTANVRHFELIPGLSVLRL